MANCTSSVTLPLAGIPHPGHVPITDPDMGAIIQRKEHPAGAPQLPSNHVPPAAVAKSQPFAAQHGVITDVGIVTVFPPPMTVIVCSAAPPGNIPNASWLI